MTADHKAVFIYTTWPTAEAAGKCGRALVGDRLAACVNILPGMTSIYRWEGAVEEAQEAVMIVKTIALQSEAVIAAVKAMHPAQVPAVVTFDAVGGAGDFLAWIADNAAP